MTLLGLMAGWSGGVREQAWRSASRARRWDWTIAASCCWPWCGNARKLRLAGNLLAAPNAVFFARNRCLTRLCDVYDAQTTIRNSAHHDIRRIRVPLHAELRCSCLYFGFSLDYNSQCPLWVKLRRTPIENMFSGLPPNSDIAR